MNETHIGIEYSFSYPTLL